jgi:hypothetical protein
MVVDVVVFVVTAGFAVEVSEISIRLDEGLDEAIKEKETKTFIAFRSKSHRHTLC